MSFEVMLVALAGIGAVLWIIHRGMRHEEIKLKAQGGGGEDVARLSATSAQTERELAQLRDRVAVLEKLVTDDDRRLAEEIGRLAGQDRQAAR